MVKLKTKASTNIILNLRRENLLTSETAYSFGKTTKTRFSRQNLLTTGIRRYNFDFLNRLVNKCIYLWKDDDGKIYFCNWGKRVHRVS